jgi:hypothetical protein
MRSCSPATILAEPGGQASLLGRPPAPTRRPGRHGLVDTRPAAGGLRLAPVYHRLSPAAPKEGTTDDRQHRPTQPVGHVEGPRGRLPSAAQGPCLARILRASAAEAVEKLVPWLVGNGYDVIDFPEGYGLARDLADVGEVDLEEVLAQAKSG